MQCYAWKTKRDAHPAITKLLQLTFECLVEFETPVEDVILPAGKK